MSARPPKLPIAGTLRRALSVVLDHARDYFWAALLVQGAIVVVGIPLVLRLFGTLDSQVEITSPTALGIGEALANPAADLLLLALVIVVALLAYLELATMLIIARRNQAGVAVTARAVVTEFGDTVQRLRHPSSLLLIPYLLLVLPGGPFGLALVLGLGVRVPDFVTGELLHSVPAAVATVAVLLVLLYVSLRLAFTMPAYLGDTALAGGTVWQAIVASWRMTRRQSRRLLAIGLIVVASSAVLIAGAFAIGMLPTRWADTNWPPAAPAIAAVSLTLIQVAVFAVVAVAVALLANAVVAAHHHGPLAGDTGPRRELEHPPNSRIPRQRLAVVAAAGVVVLAGVTAVNLATVQSLIQSNDTLVIAHRGLLSAGVENTIPALEAAAAIHPDLVEIDIQQTADDEFVVMHDPTLERLGDRPDRIRDLTLAELERIELHQNGHTALIDSLDEYIDRAVVLGQPLLVELKINGDESDDYLDRLIATLQRHGVLDQYWVHSLDKPTIEAFERREPQVPTGYIMTFNLGHAPETTADFVVMQELSYTQDLRDEVWAAGKSLLLWSVDDVPTMRNSLDDNVDGLISYEPELVQQQRERVETDTSVADRVEQYLRRLLAW